MLQIPFVPYCASLFPFVPNWFFAAWCQLYFAIKQMNMRITKDGILIKPCSPKQLAAAYGVSTKVLRRWLSPHFTFNQKKNRVYDLKQMLEIIELIGLPGKQKMYSSQ
jgi:hypothetical protein